MGELSRLQKYPGRKSGAATIRFTHLWLSDTCAPYGIGAVRLLSEGKSPILAGKECSNHTLVGMELREISS